MSKPTPERKKAHEMKRASYRKWLKRTSDKQIKARRVATQHRVRSGK